MRSGPSAAINLKCSDKALALVSGDYIPAQPRSKISLYMENEKV